MPIYEYRCPEGHTFELMQRMSDSPASECQICGAGPVEKVLYPVAIHFKGSGFYSTEYGRGGRKRDGATGSEGSTTETKKSDEKTVEKPKDSASSPSSPGTD